VKRKLSSDGELVGMPEMALVLGKHGHEGSWLIRAPAISRHDLTSVLLTIPSGFTKTCSVVELGRVHVYPLHVI
jgi:hypothetical protein